MPVPITALIPLARALANRQGNRGGEMGPPQRWGPLAQFSRTYAGADNAMRGMAGRVGQGISNGMQGLGQALAGLLGRGPSMSQTGPMQGGYQYPGQQQMPQQQTVSMPGSQVAGGTAPWMSGMLPYTQPGAPGGMGGRAGNSTGAVGWLLNRPGDEAGDAIGFMRRN